MYPSRTVTVAIDRPLQRVYEFLAEPANLTRWTQISVRDWHKAAAHVWQAGGIRIRFTPPNRFGILDIAVEGTQFGTQFLPARLYTNGEGCELAITLFRLDDMSEELFVSECAWIEADLQVLKTYLESLNT
ncbi:hypothetical protein VE25_15360 [Devosia geojensis]|uniref:Polyketide cyclase n=1 Tax=Devosia geojensis TaxID=443610 RepID=A0A0F5FPY6_9HYPH|nr:hypothetical protein [Devosia geojensis]KKB10959.1 hypothetical protein VE25_15360 [Devosia geojensis]